MRHERRIPTAVLVIVRERQGRVCEFCSHVFPLVQVMIGSYHSTPTGTIVTVLVIIREKQKP